MSLRVFRVLHTPVWSSEHAVVRENLNSQWREASAAFLRPQCQEGLMRQITVDTLCLGNGKISFPLNNY